LQFITGGAVADWLYERLQTHSIAQCGGIVFALVDAVSGAGFGGGPVGASRNTQGADRASRVTFGDLLSEPGDWHFLRILADLFPLNFSLHREPTMESSVPKLTPAEWLLKHRIAALTGAAALVLLLVVYRMTNVHPRTDDASVRANYIALAPEVTGRLVALHVHDNEFVKAGTVLFEIDPRPYQFALDQALSDQQLLEQQILDQQKRIAAQQDAVAAARAGITGAHSQRLSASGSASAADASVERAKAYLEAMHAQNLLAASDLHRIEPLLAKKYVTTQQVDDARTHATVAQHNEQQAHAMLDEATAQQLRAKAQQQEATSAIEASNAHLSQSINSIDRQETLEAQRTAKAARVAAARLDVERCTVRAPFDGFVTNLNISEGEMAKPGVALFTLIDNRNWYVVANYRESDLRHIAPGRPVDLFLLDSPSHHFEGVVESIGTGVAPDDANVQNGLPQIDHTLNWVHLAARFPVRIRVLQPDTRYFRVGATAVSIVR